MSGQNSDQVHRSTLGVYANLLEHFNPSLQKLTSLGNSYVQAFQALAVSSEAYFGALAKMGEQALRSMSSYTLGDILIQISDSQRKLMAELEGVFQWFHNEVLQEMDNNVKLDKDYLSTTKRHYEMGVRSQATALERHLKRGGYRDTQNSSDYMQFLWQCQQEALKEEERRFRFLAEKHCGLTQSILYLINKTGLALQQRAEHWRDRVNKTRNGRSRTLSHHDHSSMHGMRAEDGASPWTSRKEHMLRRLPSRGLCPEPRLPRSDTLGESPGSAEVKLMRALVSHRALPDPTLLSFSRGDTVTVLIQEPHNGWLYGRVLRSLRQGWFPAAYVEPLEDTLLSRDANDLPQPSSSNSQNIDPSSPPPLPASATVLRKGDSTFDTKGRCGTVLFSMTPHPSFWWMQGESSSC